MTYYYWKWTLRFIVKNIFYCRECWSGREGGKSCVWTCGTKTLQVCVSLDPSLIPSLLYTPLSAFITCSWKLGVWEAGNKALSVQVISKKGICMLAFLWCFFLTDLVMELVDLETSLPCSPRQQAPAFLQSWPIAWCLTCWDVQVWRHPDSLSSGTVPMYETRFPWAVSQ